MYSGTWIESSPDWSPLKPSTSGIIWSKASLNKVLAANAFNASNTWKYIFFLKHGIRNTPINDNKDMKTTAKVP